MKSLLSKVSVTTFVIIYLFFCGGLYLLAYWSTFNFDITNYISFEDVPKSFIFPVLTAFGIILFIWLCTFSYQLLAIESKKDNRTKQNTKPKPTKLKKAAPSIVLVFLVISTFYFPLINKKYALFVIASGVCLLLFVAFETFISNENIKNIMPDFYKRLAITIALFLVPGLIFITAKVRSFTIFNNEDYYSVSNIRFLNKDSSDNEYMSYKLLGKLGNHLFLADSSNSVITVLNTDEIKLIEYKKIDNGNK